MDIFSKFPPSLNIKNDFSVAWVWPISLLVKTPAFFGMVFLLPLDVAQELTRN